MKIDLSKLKYYYSNNPFESFIFVERLIAKINKTI